MLLWWKAAQLMSLLKLASVSWINSVIAHRRLFLRSQHSLTDGAMLPLWLRGGVKHCTQRIQERLEFKYWIKLFLKIWKRSLNVERWLKLSPPAQQNIFEHFIEWSVILLSSYWSDLAPINARRIWISSTCESRLSVKEMHVCFTPVTSTPETEFIRWETVGSDTQCRCSWHDSHGHAITSPQSFLLDAISADGLRWHRCQLSLCLSHCHPPLSQFNIMSAWPEGFSQPVYSSKVESTQQNHSQWKHTITVWIGFIISLFCCFSPLSCGFFPVTDLQCQSRTCSNHPNLCLIVSFYLLHGSLHRWSNQINVFNYSHFHQRV